MSHDKYSKKTINGKSVDSVLGTRTQGGRMVGADKSIDGTPDNQVVVIQIFEQNSIQISGRPARLQVVHHAQGRYRRHLQTQLGLRGKLVQQPSVARRDQHRLGGVCQR